MKGTPQFHSAIRVNSCSSVAKSGLWLVLLPVLTISSIAQEVLAPPPPEFAPKPATTGTYNFPTAATNLSQVMPSSEPTTPGPSTVERYLDWGPIHLHPHLLYRVSYGDGLQARPGEHDQTLINELSPGMLLNIGDHWRLD